MVLKHEKSYAIQATYIMKKKLASNELTTESIKAQLKEKMNNVAVNMLHILRTMEIAANAFSRLTMFDDRYHEQNEETCKTMFGLESWKKLKVFVATTMPEIDIKRRSHPLAYDKKRGAIHFQQFTDF